jgi:signal transduction histidine kinase
MEFGENNENQEIKEIIQGIKYDKKNDSDKIDTIPIYDNTKDDYWNLENYFNRSDRYGFFSNIGVFYINNNKSNAQKYYNIMHRSIKISDSNKIDNFFFTDISSVICYKLSQIQESNQRQRMFAKISHEFKTPLNSIIGMISYILNPTRNNDSIPNEIKNDLKVLSNLSNYVIFLISDIIQYTNNSIESSGIKININFVNLKEVMDFCFQILNSLLFCNINKKEKIMASLIFDESLELIKIMSDELRIKQILLNLIGNAVKFTNEGEIKIKCKKIDINGKLYVKISIYDSGKGIKESDKEKLFNDFVMLEPSKSDDNKFGSGLGLSICKNIAEKLNLILDFKTKFGKGSKFFIFIPIHTEFSVNDIDEFDSCIMNEGSKYSKSFRDSNYFKDNNNIKSMDNQHKKHLFDLMAISDNYQRKFCAIVRNLYKLFF